MTGQMQNDADEKRSEAEAAPSCTFVIFGASGDLTKRVVMPDFTTSPAAIYSTPHLRIGVDRVANTDEGWRKIISEALVSFSKEQLQNST